ncbi:MAG: cytochrome P460 family protein [Patescibacteria group bacterium]|nr:cytochrome P460 family protein [Patescibacteria group bacterium]MDE2217985.1 cytochrome P460 family protein [Patescibacteria group bacterium]
MKKILGLLVAFFGFFIYVAGCATTTNSPSSESEPAVTVVLHNGYPDGYQFWTNTASKVVLDKTSPFYGFQRVLVSDTALPTYKSGRGEYPEGSRLVLEFNEPIPEGPHGDVIKGDPNWIAVMIKYSPATTTGGWFFEAFDGKTKVSKNIDPVKGCYECHTAMKSNHYVFSNKCEVM